MTKLILTTIFWFLTAIEFALLARVLLSWFPNVSSLYSVKKFLYEITEPILQPIRKLIDKSIFQGNGSIFDISPLIAFIVIDALKAIV
ncbi:MAG: YggT family protein [Eubacteriales bacterium]|nr:YggT family protein [Eubacteriales bacterium]